MDFYDDRIYLSVATTWKSLVPLIAICLSAWFSYRHLFRYVNWKKDYSSKFDSFNHTKKDGYFETLPPVYPNGWFALAESSEVPVGKVIHVSALGEDFAVFRGEDGICIVADAWCPHLGANLALGGSVVGNCIQCPFHNWMFDGKNGECKNVPYSDKAPNFAKLKLWKSVEVNNVIFVWYHADNEEPTWHPPTIPSIQSGKAQKCGQGLITMRAQIQDIPENLCDFGHFGPLHSPSFFGGSVPGFKNSLWSNMMTHNWTIAWEASKDGATKHKFFLELTHTVNLPFLSKVIPSVLKFSQHGPGCIAGHSDSIFGRNDVFVTLTPLAPNKLLVREMIYSTGVLTKLSGLFLSASLIVMIERDMEIWAGKKYLNKPLLVTEEKNIAQVRRWYNQFYSENSPRITALVSKMDW